MANPRFYCADLSDDSTVITLSSEESRHLTAVRRMRTGDAVSVMNGKGLVANATVSRINKRASELRIQDCREAEKPRRHLTVVTGIPKGDRQRFMIEALVQLGVARIIPLESAYSATSISHKSLEKWPRYAIEAMKQSGNPWLPEISAGIALEALLGESAWFEKTQCFLADPAFGASPSKPEQHQRSLVLVGPEGGFSALERESILKSGFHLLRLDGYILRTEVAAIGAALTLLDAR